MDNYNTEESYEAKSTPGVGLVAGKQSPIQKELNDLEKAVNILGEVALSLGIALNPIRRSQPEVEKTTGEVPEEHGSELKQSITRTTKQVDRIRFNLENVRSELEI